jgi:hypothetical protein
MKAPANSGGISIGVDEYVPDKQGIVLVPLSQVAMAKSHGFISLDPEPAETRGPRRDPNVRRASDSEPVRLVPARLTDSEKEAIIKAGGAPPPEPAPKIEKEAAPRDKEGKRLDGPTLAEWVKAGYAEDAYPPDGYSDRRTPEELADADKKKAKK